MNENVRTKGVLSSVQTNRPRIDVSRFSESLVDQKSQDVHCHGVNEGRPLSYTLIDFDTTKALNDSALAHAANRDKGGDLNFMK